MDPCGILVMISSQELHEFTMTVHCFLFFRLVKMNLNESAEITYALSFVIRTLWSIASNALERPMKIAPSSFFLNKSVSPRLYHM